MNIRVHFDTFATAAGAEPTEHGSLRGTVFATIAGKDQMVDCVLHKDGDIALRGFVGRSRRGLRTSCRRNPPDKEDTMTGYEYTARRSALTRAYNDGLAELKKIRDTDQRRRAVWLCFEKLKADLAALDKEFQDGTLQ